MGPLPPSEGKTYVLTMIDRATKWPEAIPLSEITALNIARTLVNVWFSQFGVPSRISTNQGKQFDCDLLKKLSEAFGIHII